MTAVRVAFAGPATTFAAHALHGAAGGIEPRFFDVRPGANPRAMLQDFAPHVVVAFVPEAALDGLDAAVLAVVTEDGPDPAGADRVLRVPGDRPLPVDDRLYAPVREPRQPPRALYVGRSTPHRERLLIPAKHAHDVVHYAHGLVGGALREAVAGADVGIALQGDPGPGFPPQALLHLAAGHLLLSEPLAPACGLAPGVDFLEIRSGEEIVSVLDELRRAPERHERVRAHGRRKAEEHRASVVWPPLVRDLAEAFGTARTLHA